MKTIKTTKPFPWPRLPKGSWAVIRGLLTIYCLIMLIVTMNRTQEQNMCGVVVERKDWQREGSKGRVYSEEYIIMKWDHNKELKRLNVSSETFFELKIGDRACFDQEINQEEKFNRVIIWMVLSCIAIAWWMSMGFHKAGF